MTPPMKFPVDKAKKLNFRRNLVKRHKFVGYLDEWFANEPEGFEYTHTAKGEDDAWHPSGHCTPSVIDLYYAATDPDPHEWGASMNKAFAVGHFWHQLLQHAVLQIGLAKPEDIERVGVRDWGERIFTPPEPSSTGAVNAVLHQSYKPYHWVKGAGDIAPLRLPKHGEYLVDFKTMGSRHFKAQGLPDGFEEKYEAQINIYMDLFDLEKALIVGINKDTGHEFKEIEFVRNQPLIDAIYRKWEFVSECIDAEIVPSQLDADCFSLKGYFQGEIAQ